MNTNKPSSQIVKYVVDFDLDQNRKDTFIYSATPCDYDFISCERQTEYRQNISCFNEANFIGSWKFEKQNLPIKKPSAIKRFFAKLILGMVWIDYK